MRQSSVSCLSMCRMGSRRQRKKIVRRMTWPCHTASSLSFIKPRSLTPTIISFYAHTLAHRQRSGYSGWCYSRCGLVEVSMLWPCYPGKRESIRGMPGEEETLYQKHISPRGCITVAIQLQIKRARAHGRLCTCGPMWIQLRICEKPTDRLYESLTGKG